jgi:hypothetical protein
MKLVLAAAILTIASMTYAMDMSQSVDRRESTFKATRQADATPVYEAAATPAYTKDSEVKVEKEHKPMHKPAFGRSAGMTPE